MKAYRVGHRHAQRYMQASRLELRAGERTNGIAGYSEGTMRDIRLCTPH